MRLNGEKVKQSASGKGVEGIVTNKQFFYKKVVHMKINQKLLSFALLIPSIMSATQDPFAMCEELYRRSQYDTADACYSRQYQAFKDIVTPAVRARAETNWGDVKLALGYYKDGWALRESRGELMAQKLEKKWDGSDPRGKTILVRTMNDGGWGDIFFFLRYVSLLNDLGAYTIIEVPAPLKNLFMQCGKGQSTSNCKNPFIDAVISPKDPTPDFDYDVRLMDLPKYLAHNNVNNTISLGASLVSTIPTVGQYMFADNSFINKFKAMLPTNTFNIGICWKASALPASAVRKLERDIPLGLLSRIGAVPGIKIYNITLNQPVRQRDATATTSSYDIIPNDAPSIISFANFDSVGGAFMDTAAAIAAMDLIISVDTAVPNLAGALYKPTWILLPYESDWRWGSDRSSTSPWHPKARLFWQPSQGNWEPVVEQVIAALKQLVNK